MKKIIIPVLSLLLLLPFTAKGANDLTLSEVNIDVGGFTLIANGVVDEMVTTAANVTFTLSSGSSLSVKSNQRKTLGNNLGLNMLCTDSYSQITVSGNSAGSSLIITPSETSCGGSSGSGAAVSGGGATPTPTPTPTTAMPTTTTGQVTATASAGGKTTLTTSEGTKATAELPANAVSASTAVNIATQAKDTVISSRPTPSGRTVVGSSVYDYTAAASGASVSSFSKTITLTFTYTDNQISGLSEAGLRVFYWKESISQWVALPTTVNAANNTLTALTDHFTYFAIMGLTQGEEAAAKEIAEEKPQAEATVNEGDIVKNPNASGLARFDIYIVKLVGSKKFKRLILSPHVFESYGHLKWENVKDISQAKMDEYITSDLVRAAGDTKVYKLTPAGDTGVKQWLNMTADQFISQGYDANSIYEINTTDRNAYTAGTDIVVAGASRGETIIIKVSLRVRSLPSLDGKVLTTVNKGEVYDLLDEQNGWYKITTKDGITGWCYGGEAGGYAAKQ